MIAICSIITCVWNWRGTCGSNAVGSWHQTSFASIFGKET